MLMDRKKLIYDFDVDNIPRYPCPYCNEGVLKLVGDFCSEETEGSKSEHDSDCWDPDFVVLRFSCRLQCTSCSDVVFVVGTGGVDENHDLDGNGHWQRNYIKYYSPKYFHPPLAIVRCPARTPYLVAQKVTAASSLFFASPEACCNSIRTAAEEILNNLDVPVLDKKKKYLSFGQRIAKLNTEMESIKVLFDAVRWLGNHGSHPGDELNKSHALDAFTIVELIIEELYSDKKTETHELAKRINEAKGPVGRGATRHS